MTVSDVMLAILFIAALFDASIVCILNQTILGSAHVFKTFEGTGSVPVPLLLSCHLFLNSDCGVYAWVLFTEIQHLQQGEVAILIPNGSVDLIQ